MSRPSGSTYQDAVQAPALALEDPGLRGYLPSRDALGLPLSWSGAYATIFRMQKAGCPDLALRCFTQDMPGARERYQALEAFRTRCPQPLAMRLLRTRMLERGIRVNGEWHPVILLPWFQGPTLDRWVRDHLRETDGLRAVQENLRALAAASEQAGFVHGDLQHRNILVGEGGPMLVDYDNAFPPGCGALPRTASGIAGFRHPAASGTTPPLAMDRFAQIILHTALEALAAAPDLLATRGDLEGLLFLPQDLVDPNRSELFLEFRRRSGLAAWAKALIRVLAGPAEVVPTLDAFIREACPARSLAARTWDGTVGLNQAALDILDRLYRPGGALDAAAQPGPKSANAIAQATHPAQAGIATRPRRRGRILLALAASLALAAGWQQRTAIGDWHWPGSDRTRRIEAVREVARTGLRTRKDQLMLTIIELDGALQNLSAVPDEVRLAVPDPVTGEVRGSTCRALRRELAETRELARTAMLRCDEVLPEFDALAGTPGVPLGTLRGRVAGIQGLPLEARNRIARDW